MSSTRLPPLRRWLAGQFILAIAQTQMCREDALLTLPRIEGMRQFTEKIRDKVQGEPKPKKSRQPKPVALKKVLTRQKGSRLLRW